MTIRRGVTFALFVALCFLAVLVILVLSDTGEESGEFVTSDKSASLERTSGVPPHLPRIEVRSPENVIEAGTSAETTPALNATIFGRVVDSNGNAAPIGTIVHVRRIGVLEDRTEEVSSSAGGYFSFDQSFTSGFYEVWAASFGVVSEVLRVRVESTSVEVELTGGRIWVAKVDLIDSESRMRIKQGARLLSPGSGISERFVGGTGARHCPTFDARLVEAGIGIDAFENGGEPPWTLVSLTDFEVATPPIALVTARVVGFHEAAMQIEYSVPDNAIQSHSLFLKARSGAWGTIKFVSEGLEDLAVIPGDSSQVMLRLFSESLGTPQDQWIEFTLSDGLDGLEVPCGRYKIAGRYLGMQFELRDEELNDVEVREGEVSRVRFGLEGMQYVQLVPSDSNGVEYMGPFSGALRMQESEERRVLPFYFPGPPYTFVALPPGEYSLMTDPPVMFPPPADPREAGAKFMVGPETAGVVHDLEVVF